MALVQNIAGVSQSDSVGLVTSTGQVTGNAGLYSQIINIGEATAAKFVPEVAAAMAIQAAVQAGINLLPPGGLKKWLTTITNPAAFAEAIITLIKGRTYTTGQYRLAERYIDQVLSPGGNPNSILSYRDVPDNVVPAAIVFFTVVFGVRVTTDEDLWALDSGSTAYRARPGLDSKGMADIPEAALSRAVFLKQTYYPASTYNTSTWDLDHFSQYPLVAPIPDPYEFGKLYTGPLPGGGNATDGQIIVNVDTPLSSVAPAPTTAKKDNSLLILGGLLAAGAWLYYRNKKTKKRAYAY
jgi:LPXTG-motif cell wall-anchored protein